VIGALETEPRGSCAVNLDLSHGRHPASARIEWSEPESGAVGSDATVALRGWIDLAALHGLESTLEELGRRGVRRLSLDCTAVRHVEFGAVPPLTRLLSDSAPGGLRLHGLSPHLRDLFRLAGCKELVPTALADVIASLPAPGARREWAT
jgi:hypothetical protein